MNWKLIGIVLAVAGAGAVLAGAAEGSELDKERRKVRAYFDVGPDCQIMFKGNAQTAEAFWQTYSGYLREMIRLAATLQITDARGVASYTMLNLFPECDQKKQLSGSFEIARSAAQYRISKLMEQG